MKNSQIPNFFAVFDGTAYGTADGTTWHHLAPLGTSWHLFPILHGAQKCPEKLYISAPVSRVKCITNQQRYCSMKWSLNQLKTGGFSAGFKAQMCHQPAALLLYETGVEPA